MEPPAAAARPPSWNSVIAHPKVLWCNDKLYGDLGTDTLNGSAGSDMLSGPRTDVAQDTLNGGDNTDSCGPVGAPPDLRGSWES